MLYLLYALIDRAAIIPFLIYLLKISIRSGRERACPA
jgi:hypothetical protein